MSLIPLFVTILWGIFIVNGIGLLGSLFLGKFLYDRGLLFLPFLMNPDDPAKAARKTVRFAGWTAISGVLLYLIYF